MLGDGAMSEKRSEVGKLSAKNVEVEVFRGDFVETELSKRRIGYL